MPIITSQTIGAAARNYHLAAAARHYRTRA